MTDMKFVCEYMHVEAWQCQMHCTFRKNSSLHSSGVPFQWKCRYRRLPSSRVPFNLDTSPTSRRMSSLLTLAQCFLYRFFARPFSSVSDTSPWEVNPSSATHALSTVSIKLNSCCTFGSILDDNCDDMFALVHTCSSRLSPKCTVLCLRRRESSELLLSCCVLLLGTPLQTLCLLHFFEQLTFDSTIFLEFCWDVGLLSNIYYSILPCVRSVTLRSLRNTTVCQFVYSRICLLKLWLIVTVPMQFKAGFHWFDLSIVVSNAQKYRNYIYNILRFITMLAFGTA